MGKLSRSSEQKAYGLSRRMNAKPIYLAMALRFKHETTPVKTMRKSCMKIPTQRLIRKDYSMRLGMSQFRSLSRGMDKDTSRLHTDRDVCKWSTDTHRGATFRTGKTPKLGNGFQQNRPDREG